MTAVIWPRIAAAVLGALVILARPYARDVEVEGYWLDTAIEYLVPLLAAYGLYYLATMPMRQKPASFLVRAGAFVVPASPRQGYTVILVSLVAGGADLPAVTWAIFALGHLAWLPALRLTPRGLEVRTLRTRRIGWDGLVPELPSPKASTITLRPLLHQINLYLFHVDGVFLAHAIRHYASHPEFRAAIGKQSELDRLLVH